MPSDNFIDVRYPSAGLDNSTGYERNVPRVSPDGNTYQSAQDAANVRAYTPGENRLRGGSRGGLSKLIDQRIPNAEWVIQSLGGVAVVLSSALPGGGGVQTSQSGRVEYRVAVSQGNVYSSIPGGTSWTVATNDTAETPPLNASGIMYMTALNQKVWFADGINWCYWQPSDNTVNTWTATAGTLPVDDDNNTPRLICTWRGRIVLSGLLRDPQDVFMSAVNVPTDFDYSPSSTTPTQAVAFSVSQSGIVGEIVTALIPYTDDTLIVGSDHCIYVLTGDPLAGGVLNVVTKAVGIAWGQAWCQDPYGTIWFFSNGCGVYSMVPGQLPVRRSQGIENILRKIDTGKNAITMAWNNTTQGLRIFVTPLVYNPRASTQPTHFFYEARTGSWWTDTFANYDHNPGCCCAVSGNTDVDRTVMIGSWDGYVRAEDHTAEDDDGTPIESSVTIGPILTKDLDAVMLHELQAVLGESSGDVAYEVFVGRSAEAALATSAVSSGTWRASRNMNNLTKRSGHAIYVRLTSSSRWSFESVRLRVESLGLVRRRGR